VTRANGERATRASDVAIPGRLSGAAQRTQPISASAIRLTLVRDCDVPVRAHFDDHLRSAAPFAGTLS
jgi:hypothetical protein